MDEVLCSIDSGILNITINRPEQRNALTLQALGGLSEAIRRAGTDRTVRVVTMTGAGDKVFCAGADLKSIAGGSEQAFRQADYRKLLLDILRCPKPTVALARGHVMAGGLGIFLSCDLALACNDVHFSTPEIQVGMFPLMVLALLYKHVGRKRATEMLLFGERIPAAAALDYGLVNHVYPRARFDSEADRYARQLAEKSSAIFRLGKEAITQIEDKSLAEELEYLELMLGRVMASKDSKEGIRAFVEKRKPQWTDE